MTEASGRPEDEGQHWHKGTPDQEGSSEAIPLPRILPARGEDGEIIPIEEFMLSRRGNSRIANLKRELSEEEHDLSSNLINRIKELPAHRAQENGEQRDILIALEKQGLTSHLNRPELVEYYKRNPVMQRLLQLMTAADRSGEQDTKQVYGQIGIIFQNIIRCEALHGEYSPEDDSWHRMAHFLRRVPSRDHVLHHPMRINPKTRLKE